MAEVRDIYESLDRLAPFDTQESFDNAGFLVGHGDRTVRRILVALDITEEVAAEAAGLGAELIVSHHPVIFFPAKSVTDADPTGRKLLALVENGIAAICAHTNLDAAQGGVNDALARAVGLTGLSILRQSGVDGQGRPYGIGRIGTLKGADLPLADYARQVKEALGANGVRYVDGGRRVHKVAVGGGSCGEFLRDAAAQGCDTFLTADVKYDVFLDAKAMGVNLIDAGHYPTENVICPVLAQALKSAFPGIEVLISATHKEVFSYL